MKWLPLVVGVVLGGWLLSRCLAWGKPPLTTTEQVRRLMKRKAA